MKINTRATICPLSSYLSKYVNSCYFQIVVLEDPGSLNVTMTGLSSMDRQAVSAERNWTFSLQVNFTAFLGWKLKEEKRPR